MTWQKVTCVTPEPWLGPKPGRAKPKSLALAWLMFLVGQSQVKPSQSRGFQVKPGQAHHYFWHVDPFLAPQLHFRHWNTCFRPLSTLLDQTLFLSTSGTQLQDWQVERCLGWRFHRIHLYPSELDQELDWTRMTIMGHYPLLTITAQLHKMPPVFVKSYLFSVSPRSAVAIHTNLMERSTTSTTMTINTHHHHTGTNGAHDAGYYRVHDTSSAWKLG